MTVSGLVLQELGVDQHDTLIVARKAGVETLEVPDRATCRVSGVVVIQKVAHRKQVGPGQVPQFECVDATTSVLDVGDRRPWHAGLCSDVFLTQTGATPAIEQPLGQQGLLVVFGGRGCSCCPASTATDDAADDAARSRVLHPNIVPFGTTIARQAGNRRGTSVG